MDAPTVLIVDDDLGDRKMIRRMLASECPDSRTYEVTSCEEALTFAECIPDAVILDYMLPGQTGLDTLGQIRRLWPGVACFLMTGQGDEEVAKSAIKAGASDYITKRSLTPGALKRMLENGIELARMTQRLETQQQELTTFAHVLVHDFKTPVRGVLNLSQMVAEDIECGDMEAALKGLALLTRSATQMSELVESLALHIRMDRVEQRRQATLQEVAARALTALAPDISETGARIDISAPEQPLWCAPPQIAQLLQNLIANAIKYAGEAPPRIRIAAAPAADGMMQVEVHDNGIGIPEDQRDRIFEPFRRLAGGDKIPGSGLGLATCRKIVERHDGRIWCDANQDGGTTFHFTLAAQAPASPAAPVSPLSRPPGAQVH